MKAIFKREMNAYFTSPLAYFVIGSFLAITGLNFWNMNLVGRSIEFSSTLNALSSFLAFFVPIITMKLLAEEKRNGTEVLLRTSPVKMWKVVLGKYSAAFCLFLLIVLMTLVCPVILSLNMNDGGVFPWAETVGSYIGFLLLGCAYLAVGLLASGASVVSAALSALMVNARHLFYGVSMLDKYKDVGAAKPYLIFSLTDETYSLLCSEKREGKLYYLLVSLFDHIYWVSGSVLGAVAGAVIPFRTDGIDFALTALFITVFVQQWKESRDHTAAVIGIAVSLVCLILFGPSAFLIPAMVAITVALLILGRLQEGARNV